MQVDVGQRLVAVPTGHAPVSRRRLIRSLAGLVVVEAAAWLLAVFAPSPALHAAGLGLSVPGAGFLAGPDPWLMVVVDLGLVLSLFAWLGIGAIVAPALVWLGGLAGAAAIASSPVDRGADPWLGGVVGALLLLAGCRLGVGAGARATSPASRPLVYLPDPDPTPPPLAAADLQALRFIADLALQPVEDFAGFTTKDQFREAAWRYQLTAIGWALAAYQHNHAPAFDGWLAEAQRRLIAKHTDPRVWRYWRWENLVGNLRWDPDPIHSENIMLSGYLLISLGAYRSGTGRAEFSQPEALTFDDGRHRYPYDAGSIAEAVGRQMAGAWACAYPCEPNWVFAYCNLVGINGLLLHDRLHGTDHGERIRERFVTALREEFISPHGSMRTIRSNRFGFALPIKGIANDLTLTAFANSLDPDLAAWSWDRARACLAVDDEGLLVVPTTGIDRVDPGDYTMGSGFMCGSLITAAAEMGDREIADAACRSLDVAAPPTVSDGASRWAMSTFSNANAALGRFNRANGWRDLVQVGPGTASGPRLRQAAYPEVLVTSAHTDGADLRLSLAPGTDRLGMADLEISGLRSGHGYGVTGGVTQDVAADHNGNATVTVDLRGQQAVRLVPA